MNTGPNGPASPEVADLLRSLSALRRDHRPGPTLLANLAVLGAYVAAAGGMLLYSERAVDPGIWANLVPWPWVAEGIAVGAMLLAGVGLWPAIFVGSCVVWGGMRHDPPISVGIDAGGEALSLVLIVYLLRAWRFRRQFDRLRDGFVLLAAALVGRILHGGIDIAGPLIAAAIDPGAMPADFLRLVTVPGVATPVVRPEFVWTITRWELNSVAGIVLVVPALVASRQPLVRALRERPLILGGFAVLTAGWCALALTVPYAWASWPLLLLAMILVSWAAIDFGVITAALATLALCLSTALAFSQRVGPLAGTGTEGGITVVWGFVALLCCTSPVFASTLVARRHDVRRLTALADRNRHIFMGNPCPAWVVDVTSGRILHANDEATRRYGYSNAEFLTMTAGELLAAGGAACEPTPASADLIAEPFVKHRTRAGEVIDVEVASAPLEFAGRQVILSYALEMTDRQDLRRRLLAVADRERRRLAQELHDGLGQVLTGLALGAQSLLTSARRGAVLDKQSIEFTAKTIGQAEALLAQLTEGISPLEALNGDLVQALRHLPETLPPEERARMSVIVEQRASVGVSLERREHLYRIAQEAVANALKHARATSLTIRVLVDAAEIRVIIEDNGVGLRAPLGRREGLGIRSMRLRAQAMAGDCQVLARAGGGTTVECACSQTEAPAKPAIQDRPAGTPPPLGDAAPAARRSIRGMLVESALLALACCVGAAASSALIASQDPRIGLAGARLAIPSLMAGAAVAGLVLGGRRLWPGVMVGVTLAYLGIQRFPLGFSLVGGMIVAAAAYTMATAFRRLHFTRSFVRWQDPVVLVVVAAAVWTVSQFVGVSSLVFFQWLEPGSLGPGITRLLTAPGGSSPHVTIEFVVASLRWWADGFAGVVLTVPVVVAMPALWATLRRQMAEAALWTLCMAGWAVTLLTIPNARALMPLLALAILLLIWAASRFGVALASLGTLICAMTGASAFALQRGALAMTDPGQGMAFIWGFIGVLTTVGLFIAALLGEHDRGRRNIRDAAEWYKRLFDRDPRALWVHEAATGRVVAVNEQLLRTCGLSRSPQPVLRLDELFGREAARMLTEACDAAVQAPVEIRHRAVSQDFIELEVSFLPSIVDGREVFVCFAHDVTERNTLRRALVERTDVERRRLAAELRRGLEAHLLKLRTAVDALDRAVERHEPVVAILESICTQVRNATADCRECAHRASPLQASDGDFVVAIQNLHKYVAASGPRVSVTASLEAPIEIPEEQAENLYELVREAVAQCIAREPKVSIGVSVRTTARALRVAVETTGAAAAPASILSIGRESSVRLRALAMGARLWSQAGGDGGTRLVCECQNASAA